jgi:drug/metabolite transporter (DMT)-like permease
MDVPQPHPLAGLGLGLIGVTIFAATLPMTRIALAGFDPVFITCGRALIATLIAAVALALRGQPMPTGRLREFLAVGAFLVFAFPGFATLAMRTVPASHGGVVLGALPLLTAAFAALIAGERPGASFWGYSAVGAALVIAFTLAGSGLEPGMGDLWLALASVTTAFGYVVSGRLARDMPGWVVIAWALVLCAPISLAGAVWSWSSGGVHGPGAAELAALAYVGSCSMFLGFVFWNAGLALGGIARVGQVQLMQTFITLGISALLLGEKITPTMIGFALAVGATVWLGRKARVGGPALSGAAKQGVRGLRPRP